MAVGVADMDTSSLVSVAHVDSVVIHKEIEIEAVDGWCGGECGNGVCVSQEGRCEEA